MSTTRSPQPPPFLLAGLLLVGFLFDHAPSAQGATPRPGGARADDAPQVSQGLPLRRITLYRSGVGYFEHSAEILGDHRVQLHFETDKINDILKSMTILDFGGGRVGPVSYGSKEPIERRLSSFGVNLSDAPGTTELFQQLRGAELELQTVDGDRLHGTVLGVEHRKSVTRLADDAAVFSQSHLNLLTETGVRSLSLNSIGSWRLMDEKLARELSLALSALSEQRAERVKTMDLSFFAPADTSRRVMVSYVHEMPVWKTSYRLVLPDDANAAPRIQGWAIVENTTDEAWSGVELSLASGRPSSFTMDLYEPLFSQRPHLPVPSEATLVARNFESERPRSPEIAASPRVRPGRAGPASAGHPITGGITATAEHSPATSLGLALSDESRSSLKAAAMGPSQATGMQSGGQFLYTVDTPVQLERQRSAMLPILLSDIRGRRVSIYNPDDDSGHPLRGVELTNDTKLHLMPGPIAVYDSGTYAGDAQIPHTVRNQKRLLAYALDLDVGASSETTGTQVLVSIKIVDGLVEQRTKHRRTRNYAFVNYDHAKDRIILIEHRRNQGWELTTPQDAHETTERLYRFELPLPAGEEASLLVTEESVQSQSFQLRQLGLEALLAHRRNGKASDAVVEAVSKATAFQRRAQEFSHEIQRLDEERRLISSEQARIRENLNRIQPDSDLARRYVQKLGDQEDRLEEILAQHASLEEAKRNAETDLRDYLRDLDVD